MVHTPVPSAWQQQLGVDRQGMRFFSSVGAIRDARKELISAHAAETAWTRMQLDGVVAIGNSPGVYVKETRGFDPSSEDELHRKLWLHATAPLLIVIDDAQIRVYSSRPQITKSKKQSYIESLSRTADALQIYSLLDRVQQGEYFETNKNHFYPQHAIDHHFRTQLESTRDSLYAVDGRISHTKVHTILVYSLFLRYLADRGILSPSFFSKYMDRRAASLYDILRSGQTQDDLSAIYQILSHSLGVEEFCDAANLISNGPFREEHFAIIADFLSGHSVNTGQLALGSWTYDLSLLPVELISAVYQEFLSTEVENAKRSIGLVATPRNLAEVILDTAFESCTTAEPGVLDPACGSGIFLVGCFNRLANDWCHRHPNSNPAKKLAALKSLLKNNIHGIELQVTACKLAELNLLHALLGHFTDKELARIIHGPSTGQGPEHVTSVRQGNYLQMGVERQYDIIIGNPPWSNDPDAYGKWPPNQPYPARGNLTYGFAWKALADLGEDAFATLLLDGKAMLTSPPAHEFYAAWFKEAAVDTIINFADLREYLFEGKAKRPAALFRFRRRTPEAEGNKIRYITPHKSPAGKRGGLLSLSGARTQTIRYSEVLSSASSGDNALCRIWRTRLYGTARDLSLVERLGEYENLESLLSRLGGDCHEGFNRYGSSAPPEKRELLHEIPFLPTDAPRKWRYLIPESSSLLRPYGGDANKDETDLVQQWPSDADRLFKGPRVVLHHTPVNAPAFFQAAYSDASFSFHKEIHAIYCASFSTTFLKFMAGVLTSQLAYYFMFQTSLSWGVESIPQLRKLDVLNLPFPDFRSEKERLIEEVASAIDMAGKGASDAAIEATVNELVFEYYDIDDWERDLVIDAVETVSPSALTNNMTSWWPPRQMVTDGERYLQRLIGVLNDWLSERPITGRVYISATAGTGMVKLNRNGDEAAKVLMANDALTDALRNLRDALRASNKAMIPQEVLLFEGDDLYITKPLIRRNWTRAAAMNDADHIISSLLRQRS